MPCNEYLELISAHIDNEISPADERRLQAHLAECEDCRALLDAFLQADSGLASLSADAPEGLKDAVMKNLPKQAKKERHVGRYFGIGLAAAAAIALAVGFSSKLPSLNTKKESVREIAPMQNEYQLAEVGDLGAVPSLNETPATLPPVQAEDSADIAAFEPSEAAGDSSLKRHHSHDTTAQTVAVLENSDGRALPELDGLEPTACFSNADDLPELPVALPDVFEDGLCFVKFYALDRETFLSIVEAYEGVLPLTYDDSFKSPSVCLYVLLPAE